MRHRKAKPTLENEDLLVIPISQTNTSLINVTGITICDYNYKTSIFKSNEK